MAGFPTRVADVLGFQPGTDPLIGNSSMERPLPIPGSTNVVVDTGLIDLPSRFKSLCIVVTTGFTWVTSGQATIQLFAARSIYGTLGTTGAVQSSGATTGPTNPYLGSSGAASSFPTGNVPNTCQLVGSAVSFGPSGTSIAAGIYWFTTTSPGNPNASPPTTLTELTQPYPCLGVELKFPSAPSAGAFQAFFEVSPL